MIEIPESALQRHGKSTKTMTRKQAEEICCAWNAPGGSSANCWQKKEPRHRSIEVLW